MHVYAVYFDAVTYHDDGSHYHIACFFYQFFLGIKFEKPISNPIGKKKEQGYCRWIQGKACMQIALQQGHH